MSNYIIDYLKATANHIKYCDSCDELFLSYVLRHETNEDLVEQGITPKYCPICGKEVE